MPEFTHLHLHTQYSLLDGAIRVDELFPKCRASTMNLDAVVVRLAARKAELMREMSEGMEVVR